VAPSSLTSTLARLQADAPFVAHFEEEYWTLRLARSWRDGRVSHAQFLITSSGTVFDKKLWEIGAGGASGY